MDIDENAYFAKERLELQLNDLNEKILGQLNLPDSLEDSSNTYLENKIDNFDLESGKSQDVLLQSSFYDKNKIEVKPKKATTIPDDFSLDFDMVSFALSKYIKDPNSLFDEFKLYYQAKGTIYSDWEKVWQRWVTNQNKYKSPLEKTLIDKDMVLNDKMIKLAKKYIDKDTISVEFVKFKNHYIASGDIKVSWLKAWENWAIKHKQFNSQQTTASQEKNDYRWNFRKAKEVSDKIKKWLKFEKKINWLDDYYWKDIPIPGIGWQDVMHPDFNKKEILLYKIDSEDGKFMLENKSDDIIDIEILENE